MDPGGQVHATPGFLPRKSIALLRDWTSAALARIAPSFRIGPVLVDPETIRLPSRLRCRKASLDAPRHPTSWRDDPIIAATQDAMLPDEPATAQEGYVRVRIEARGRPRLVGSVVLASTKGSVSKRISSRS